MGRTPTVPWGWESDPTPRTSYCPGQGWRIGKRLPPLPATAVAESSADRLG